MNNVKTLRLEQEINSFKSDIAALRALQQEKDHLQQAYETVKFALKLFLNNLLMEISSLMRT